MPEVRNPGDFLTLWEAILASRTLLKDKPLLILEPFFTEEIMDLRKIAFALALICCGFISQAAVAEDNPDTVSEQVTKKAMALIVDLDSNDFGVICASFGLS